MEFINSLLDKIFIVVHTPVFAFHHAITDRLDIFGFQAEF